MTERIEKAIDTLLDAYNNRILRKADCGACAIGNLVANAIGRDIQQHMDIKTKKQRGDFWHCALLAHRNRTQANVPPPLPRDSYIASGEDELDLLDFTMEEIDTIERLFEDNTKIHGTIYPSLYEDEIRKDQLNGLKAVVEYLLTLDETGEHETYEKVFLNRCEVIPS